MLFAQACLSFSKSHPRHHHHRRHRRHRHSADSSSRPSCTLCRHRLRRPCLWSERRPTLDRTALQSEAPIAAQTNTKDSQEKGKQQTTHSREITADPTQFNWVLAAVTLQQRRYLRDPQGFVTGTCHLFLVPLPGTAASSVPDRPTPLQRSAIGVRCHYTFDVISVARVACVAHPPSFSFSARIDGSSTTSVIAASLALWGRLR